MAKTPKLDFISSAIAEVESFMDSIVGEIFDTDDSVNIETPTKPEILAQNPPKPKASKKTVKEPFIEEDISDKAEDKSTELDDSGAPSDK